MVVQVNWVPEKAMKGVYVTEIKFEKKIIKETLKLNLFQNCQFPWVFFSLSAGGERSQNNCFYISHT